MRSLKRRRCWEPFVTPSSAVVPEATVTLDQCRHRGLDHQDDQPEGSYEFFTVPAGIYLLTVEKAGFAMALVENVSVQVGSRLRLDAQMNVGQVTEKVSVTATAPLIETDTSAAQPDHHRRSDQGAAAQRPRIFVARAADDRRPAVRVNNDQPARRAKAPSTSTACAAPSTTS